MKKLLWILAIIGAIAAIGLIRWNKSESVQPRSPVPQLPMTEGIPLTPRDSGHIPPSKSIVLPGNYSNH